MKLNAEINMEFDFRIGSPNLKLCKSIFACTFHRFITIFFRELLTDLTTRLNELTEDHTRKSQALSLDNKCMGVREKLPSHDFQVSNQCERNMKLTGTLRNASRYLENSTVVK